MTVIEMMQLDLQMEHFKHGDWPSDMTISAYSVILIV